MKIAKTALTVRLDPAVVEFIDYNSDMNHESKGAIVNHIIKLYMEELGIALPGGQITLKAPITKKTPDTKTSGSFLDKIK